MCQCKQSFSIYLNEGGVQTSATCLCSLDPSTHINNTHILNKLVLFLVQNMMLWKRWQYKKKKVKVKPCLFFLKTRKTSHSYLFFLHKWAIGILVKSKW